MITEKSNRLQVIMITDYDYPNSDNSVHEFQNTATRELILKSGYF